MEFLASLFVSRPENILAVSVFFAAGYIMLQFIWRKAVQRPRMLLIASAFWGLYHAYSDKDDGHVDNKALAVGAGLAIVGALVAASLADKDSGSQPAGDLKVEKTVLEDECHDELSYRMRDEHHHRADVRIQTADLQGRNMKGKGKVVWDNHRADHFSYTCYFNGQGRVHDSSYHLY